LLGLEGPTEIDHGSTSEILEEATNFEDHGEETNIARVGLKDTDRIAPSLRGRNMLRLVGIACLSTCLIALISYVCISNPKVELVSAYSRAVRIIAEGHLQAKQGQYSEAAASFLKAKDLWKRSGKPGWQSAESLADAAVDKNPAALKDGMWMVRALTRQQHQQERRGGKVLTRRTAPAPRTQMHAKLSPPPPVPSDSRPRPSIRSPAVALPRLAPLGQQLEESSRGKPAEEDMPTFDIKTSQPADQSDWTLKWNRKSNPVEAGKMDDKRWGVVEHLWPKGNPQKEVFPEVPYYERKQAQAYRYPAPSRAVSPPQQGPPYSPPASQSAAFPPLPAEQGGGQNLPPQSAPFSPQVPPQQPQNASVSVDCSPCPQGQYELAPCSAVSDRICSPCSACPTGYWNSQNCSKRKDTQCSPCSACPVGYFARQTCGRSADVACASCSSCQVGTYMTSPCSSERDTQCANCSSAPCPQGFFQVEECSPMSDKMCRSCSMCGSTQYTLASCTSMEDTVCGECSNLPCPDGYYRAGCGYGQAGKCEGPLPHWSPVLSTPPPPPPPIHKAAPIDLTVPKLPPLLPRLPGLKLIFPDNSDWNAKSTYDEYVLPAPPVKWKGYQPGQSFSSRGWSWLPKLSPTIEDSWQMGAAKVPEGFTSRVLWHSPRG